MTDPRIEEQIEAVAALFPKAVPVEALGVVVLQAKDANAILASLERLKILDAQPMPVEPTMLAAMRLVGNAPEVINYIDSLQSALQVAQWNASKFQSLAQANQQLVEIISKRTEKAEAALKLAQDECIEQARSIE